MIGLSYALDYQWTSFSKANKPVMMPPTAFCSGSTVTGNLASGGDCYFKIGESGANYSLKTLYNASGVEYLTSAPTPFAWATTGALPRYDSPSSVTGSNILIASGSTWFYRDPIKSNLFIWKNTARTGRSNFWFIFGNGNYSATAGINNLVIWGTLNYITATASASNASVIWWTNNYINGIGTNSAIIWGNANALNAGWNNMLNSVIVWWFSNSMQGSDVNWGSAIVWWNGNIINLNHSFEAILWWSNNTLWWANLSYAQNSVILWWGSNSIKSTSTSPNSSAIVAGLNNWIYSNQSIILWGNKNNINEGAHNSLAMGSWTTVVYKDTFAFNNSWAYSTTVTGSFLVRAYGGMRVGWGIYDLLGNAYITSSAIAGIMTGYTVSWAIVRPWTGTQVPTSKAVVDYIDLSAQNLGDIITTGAYYLSNTWNTTVDWTWRITTSWWNLSFQMYTGWVWVEKWNILQ